MQIVVAGKSCLENAYYLVSILAGIVTGAAALGAWVQYQGNSKREQVKWAVSLFEKFYESNNYKEFRELLDDRDAKKSAKVEAIVHDKDAKFTDYLNFFELIAFLVEKKQLTDEIALNLFRYYLRLIVDRPSVMEYIRETSQDFEKLRAFLDRNREKLS